MCNAFGYTQPIGRLVDDFADLLPFAFEGGRIPNLELHDMFRPTDSAPIVRACDRDNRGAGLELIERRWWLVPGFFKGPLKEWKALCTNARAESIDTTPAYRDAYRRRRCIVPATHFFEWKTDPETPKAKKTRLRISVREREAFYFAGLWDLSHPADLDAPLESFTLATCPPGPDMKPYHHRQPVILDAAGAAQWLRLDGPGKALLTPSPAGTLNVVENA